MTYNGKTRMLHIHNHNFYSTLFKVRKHEIARPSKLAILGSISILNQIALLLTNVFFRFMSILIYSRDAILTLLGQNLS